MANLAELMSNPDLLESEAKKFAEMCCQEQQIIYGDPCDCDADTIQSAEQLGAIFDRIGRNHSIDYKRFCEIGREDY